MAFRNRQPSEVDRLKGQLGQYATEVQMWEQVAKDKGFVLATVADELQELLIVIERESQHLREPRPARSDAPQMVGTRLREAAGKAREALLALNRKEQR